MADDLILNAGSGGDTLGADDIGGVKYQRVKLIVGANGTNDGDVATGNPMPVSDAGGSLTVDGSVTANAGTNLNTSALALEAGGNLATVAALSKAEDAAHSSGNTGVMALAVRSATVADLSAGNTDGDYEPLQVSAAGRLWVSATVDAALPAGANAIGKLAANSGVDIGDVDVTSVAGTVTVGGVAAHDAAVSGNPVLTAGRASAAVPTDVSADGDATDIWTLRSGAVAVQETYGGVLGLAGNGAAGTGVQRVTVANDSTGILAGVTTVTTVTTLSTVTGGGVAHDGADSGNPIKVGFKAETSPKGITLVADGDRTDAYADSDGMLMVKHWTSGADRISERVSNTDGSSTAFSTFGATASSYNNICDITIHNAHATTNGYVDLRDGSAGSVIWTFPAPATGGVTHHFDPPLKQPTANTALAFDVSAAITTIYISVNGFQSKV